MEYAALFEPQLEGGYLITFPDFDWGISQGDAPNYDPKAYPRWRTAAESLPALKSGSRGTRADQGVRPTSCTEFPVQAK